MPNAIEMLREDHRKVKQLFDEFEHAEESQAKEQIVENTVRELEVHAALEEEIFIPPPRSKSMRRESIDEAREEHHVVKLIIGELKKMRADDERYDAKYKVLSESVKHHIEEEESELFPKLEGELDAEGLGTRMETRKQELQRQPRKRSGVRSVKSRKSHAKTEKEDKGGQRKRGGKQPGDGDSLGKLRRVIVKNQISQKQRRLCNAPGRSHDQRCRSYRL